MDWTQFMIAGAGLVLTGVVIPLLNASFAWLRSKTQNEALSTALGEAQMVADNVVSSLKATVTDGLKAKSADGKLTAAEAKEVADMAVKQFLSDLSVRSLALIQEGADDITAYAGRLIEARLLRLKGGNAS